MLFDVALKEGYFTYSRFASIELKNLYFTLIFLRPILIAGLITYTAILRLKNLCVKWRRSKMKFKDDVTYQADKNKEAEVDCCSEFKNLPVYMFKDAVRAFLCYCGFMRLI